MPVSNEEIAAVADELYARAERGDIPYEAQKLMCKGGLSINLLLERQKRTNVVWPITPAEVAYHLRNATFEFDGDGQGADNEPSISPVDCGVLRQAADMLEYLDKLVTPFARVETLGVPTPPSQKDQTP